MVVAVAHHALLVDHDYRPRSGADTRRHGRVGLGHRLIDVGQQRHIETVLGRELLMRGEILRGDPYDRGVQGCEVLGAVAVGAELLGANHRVIARIEQQDDALAAMIRELEGTFGPS